MAIRLLIVEKDGRLAALAHQALAPSEWRVATEDDPGKALFGVSAVTPDLIVCAADLGEMSGAEFVARVRKIDVAAHLPVVVAGEGEGVEGVFRLPASTEPAAFANALFDALAEVEVDEEEIAEAIELEEAFGSEVEESAESVELPEGEGDAFDLSTAVEGIELLESIELPEDEGFFLLEPTGLPAQEEAGEVSPEEAATEPEEGPEPAGSAAPVAEAEEIEALLPEADAEAIAAMEEDFAASQFAIAETEGTEEGPARAEPPALEVSGALELDSVTREALRRAVAEAVAKTLDPAALSSVISASVEKIVWEVVPPLAEKLIYEAIEKLRNPPGET